MKICGISTKASPIRTFMISNLNYAASKGAESFAISKMDEDLTPYLGSIQHISIDMTWGNPRPSQLIKDIYHLYKIFKKYKFDVIQYATSNASLNACIAGFFAHIPVRIYCQWGISYGDYKGIKGWIYKMMEKLTCSLSTSVQPDSIANLEFSIVQKLYPKEKGEVIHHGSATGVDLSKYDISHRMEWRAEIRSKYNIPSNAFLFGFVGRLSLEKGMNELLEAFNNQNNDNIYLMVVGPEYNSEMLNQQQLNAAKKNKHVIFVGPVPSAEKYFAALDWLVLPSYREGFGMVLIEAAATGTPSMISNIKGPTDFVKDEINGLIFDVKSVSSLTSTLNKAINMSKDSYQTIARRAYEDASSKFNMKDYQEAWWENRLKLYKQCH